MRRALRLVPLLLAVACAPQEAARRGAPGAAGTAAGAAAGTAGAAQREALAAQAARLPETVASFTRGSTVWHEPEQPGMGVSVDYAGPARAAVATISLYDRGQGRVADTAGDARLALEFEVVVTEALRQADNRTSQQMAERGRSELAVPGGAPLSCAVLEGSYGRQEVRTTVCLGVATGRFVKVQVTAPLRPVVPVDAEPFVIGITRAARGA